MAGTGLRLSLADRRKQSEGNHHRGESAACYTHSCPGKQRTKTPKLSCEQGPGVIFPLNKKKKKNQQLNIKSPTQGAGGRGETRYGPRHCHCFVVRAESRLHTPQPPHEAAYKSRSMRTTRARQQALSQWTPGNSVRPVKAKPINRWHHCVIRRRCYWLIGGGAAQPATSERSNSPWLY